jgi:phytoene dehydrogenase-like protein
MSLESAASGQIARVIAFSLEAVGCPVVKGGSYKLVEAFQRIIEAHGGELHVGADVERVLTENGRAVGVRTAGGASYRTQGSVICSTTPHQLYERLLEGGDVSDKVLAEVRGFRYGRSDMQIHLALDEPPQWVDPDLAKVAIVHLTPDLNGVSRAINEAERGLLPEEATIAVGQPTALDPSRAPPGKAIL